MGSQWPQCAGPSPHQVLTVLSVHTKNSRPVLTGYYPSSTLESLSGKRELEQFSNHESVLPIFMVLWAGGGEEKHIFLNHIIPQKRGGIDCVGKQSWEVAKERVENCRVVFMLCVWFVRLSSWPELNLPPSPHRPDTWRRKAKGKQSRCLIRCRVIPAWWSGGGDGRRARRQAGREGRHNKCWARGIRGEVREGEQV